jgi:DNA-binding NtrC family response regulator
MLVFDAVLRHKGGILSLDSFRSATGHGGVPAPVETPGAAPAGPAASGTYSSLSRLPSLKEAEEQLVAEALRRARNNQGIAASLLGITRQALNKRLVREARSQGRAEAPPGE